MNSNEIKGCLGAKTLQIMAAASLLLFHDEAYSVGAWHFMYNNNIGAIINVDNDNNDGNIPSTEESFAVIVSRDYDESNNTNDPSAQAQLEVKRDSVRVGASFISDGAATLSSTLNVAGGTSTNGIANSGNLGTGSLGVTGSATVGSTLNVTSNNTEQFAHRQRNR
ncbi:MAG: hypothetical protein HOO93_15715 [Methyloglobulus sp.]|nr:hypothetical protein [Methyloglobulus sp.]